MKVGMYAIVGILSTFPLSFIAPMILMQIYPQLPIKVAVLIMGMFWGVSLYCFFQMDKLIIKSKVK